MKPKLPKAVQNIADMAELLPDPEFQMLMLYLHDLWQIRLRKASEPLHRKLRDHEAKNRR